MLMLLRLFGSASLAMMLIVLPAHGATVDGDLSDLAALGPPVAVSAADGPGAGPPADFGVDGTITELYAQPVAASGSGPIDSLWIGLRGDFFGTSASLNDVFVGIDVSPGSGNGIRFLGSLNNEGSDETGVVDAAITYSQIELSSTLVGIGLDAVLGVTDSGCAGADVCGLRSFGTDGMPGAYSEYAWPVVAPPLALGAGNGSLPAAAGASYAAPDAIEALIPLSVLGDPPVVALVAWVASDEGFPSPNTLPENASDAYESPQVIEAVAYRSVAEPVPLIGWGARIVVVLGIVTLASTSAWRREGRAWPTVSRVPWRKRLGRG